MNDMLRKKIEYASNTEKLFLILNNTDQKFKTLIKMWKEGDSNGVVYASKLTDNLIELRCTLNTKVGNETVQKALQNIADLYEFITNEIFKAALTKDYRSVEKSYEVFLKIKSIFEEDKKNISK